MEILNNINEGFIGDSFIIPFTDVRELKVKVPSNIESFFQSISNNDLFNGKYSEIYKLNIVDNKNIKTYMFVGLGDISKLTNREIFILFSKAFSECKKNNLKNITLYLNNIFTESVNDEILVKILESAYLADYQFNKYKSDFKDSFIEKVNIVLEHDSLNNIIEEAQACASGTILARDLVNEPAMYMIPDQLAKDVLTLGSKYEFDVEVLDEKQIENLDMNAFLAVSKGSVNKPRLVVIKYFGDENCKENICLVGKGITFDTGGYSLKNPNNLPTMYGDMGGAAAVIGAMTAISKMKLKKNVIAIIPACENRISSDAYLPGDVLRAMNGKTIEVISTDAEGRLILADAITYGIKKENVDVIIDIATLTGGSLQALGNKTAAILTNNENLCKIAEDASRKSCEKVWELPLDKELKPSLDSRIADIKNSDFGGTGASTILGALFLENFIENKPWIHIDMANVNWAKEGLPYCAKGATGYGVSLLYNMVKLIN